MYGLNFVGAGLACLAMLGAAIGVGNIFAAYLDGAMRNPSAAPQQFGNLIFGFAVTEALGIFGFAVALILIFAAPGVPASYAAG
jgi:F-type H+-transporting ATPase subunit c